MEERLFLKSSFLKGEKALIQSLKSTMQFIGLVLISALIAVSLVN